MPNVFIMPHLSGYYDNHPRDAARQFEANLAHFLARMAGADDPPRMVGLSRSPIGLRCRIGYVHRRAADQLRSA
jgi:hypothetical protein